MKFVKDCSLTPPLHRVRAYVGVLTTFVLEAVQTVDDDEKTSLPCRQIEKSWQFPAEPFCLVWDVPGEIESLFYVC